MVDAAAEELGSFVDGGSDLIDRAKVADRIVKLVLVLLQMYFGGMFQS